MAEAHPPLETLLQGRDPHAILEHSLVEAGFPGGATQKFLVDGLPGVVVRLNPGHPKKVFAASPVVNDLSRHGIQALPHLPVLHNNEAYVFTQRVTGQDLLSALGADRTGELARLSDTTWKELGQYMLESLRSDRLTALDIEGASQHMHGTVGESDPGIRLVDLSEYVVRFSESPDFFGLSTLAIAHATVDIESAAGTRLTQTRGVATEIISTAYELGILDVENNAKAAEASLEQGRKLEMLSGKLRDINLP